MRSIFGIIFEGITIHHVIIFAYNTCRKDNRSDFRMKEYLPGKLFDVQIVAMWLISS